MRDRPFDYWPTKHVDFLIPRSYYYYDTPDGQDLVKKLWFLTTSFGKVGVVHGVVMCLRDPINPPKNYAQWGLRILDYTHPWMVSPFIFAITTHFGVKLREKDDVLNYAVGGFLSGMYLGVWYKRPGPGFLAAFWFTLIAASLKYNMVMGWSNMGSYVPINYRVNTVNSLQTMDYSVIPEYPRNWHRAEEVAEKNIQLPQGKPAFPSFHTQ